MRRGVRGIAAAVAAIGALVLPATAPAATIAVDIELDQFANPTPPGFDPFCSLREAVQAANTDANFDGCERVGTGSADTIVLQGGTTYTRSRAGVDDTNASGDLDIGGETTMQVDGTGKATIDGNTFDRVIDIAQGGSLTASELVITDGNVGASQPGNDTSGGGISVNFGGELELRSSRVLRNFAPGNANCACGGGIGSAGQTTLHGVVIRANGSGSIGGGLSVAAGPSTTVIASTIADNYSSYLAGGIYAGGFDTKIEIKRSTVSGNRLNGDSGSGGGIYTGGSDTQVTLVNSTLSGNRAPASGGGISVGAGLPKLRSATISENTADADANGTGHGGGISSFNQISIRNSIIAGNADLNPTAPEPDCDTSFVTVAHNLLGNGGDCGSGPSGNVFVADPLLKPLADNGGPTETHALKATSKAIGRAGNSPATDQRGVRRDSDPDIGAFERR
ncbi:MAG: choice-of-anchor Q domain-containing protein [Solirubrobacterales bacterium]